MVRIILFILILAAIALAIYGYYEFNRKNESLTNRNPDFTLTAGDLLKEFSLSEKEAGMKYNGKILEVQGRIKKVEQDDKGFFTLILGDAASLSSVRSSVDSNNNKEVAVLMINTVVRIRGICTGYHADEMGLGADVLLNRCIMIK